MSRGRRLEEEKEEEGEMKKERRGVYVNVSANDWGDIYSKYRIRHYCCPLPTAQCPRTDDHMTHKQSHRPKYDW